MKISNTQQNDNANRLFQGKLSTNGANNPNNAQKGMLKDTKSFFAGDLNVGKDPIAQRREQAQKDAMKIIKDVFKGDSDIENDFDESKAKVEELKAEAKTASEELAKIEESRKEMEKICTPEEMKEQDAQFNKMESYYANIQKEAAGSAVGISKEISKAEIELLKQNPMVEAKNAAGEIEKNASKEIIGMLNKDMKDATDKKLEENEEKQEKIKEEKEKEEELTKAKEKEEEVVPTEVQEITKVDTDVQKKLKEIMEEQKLLQEDLKGITVDQQL